LRRSDGVVVQGQLEYDVILYIYLICLSVENDIRNNIGFRADGKQDNLDMLCGILNSMQQN